MFVGASRTCLTQVLGDVDSLSVGESSDHRCAGCRGNRGVDGVDVVAQVDRFLPSVQTRKTQLSSVCVE